VAVVRGVTVPVVHVVGVVPVRHGLMAASVAVIVVMAGVLGVCARGALVPVALVLAVGVAVVEVVGVVIVRDGGMAAAGPVGMIVPVMDGMGGAHGEVLSVEWLTASRTMWATWLSISS
jgi:hypothetical protein